MANIEWLLCKSDCHKFIFGVDTLSGERRNFLFTKDEHNSLAPVQPFPDKPYLRVMVDLFLVSGGFLAPVDAQYALAWDFGLDYLHSLAETRILFIEKSRQVLVTWVCLAYCLWMAKFFDHRLILVQSKREDDAKQLVCVKETEIDAARLTFMESHLPDELRSVNFGNRGGVTKCHVFFPNGSHIWGIPEGGSIVRSYTPSLLFSDEAAFQPAFGEAYRAALPGIHGGGQGIFVSSAEPGEFQRLVEADDSLYVQGSDDDRSGSVAGTERTEDEFVDVWARG